MRRLALTLSAVLVATTLTTGSPASGNHCTDQPVFDPSITSPEDFVPGFPDQRVTTQQILDYFRLVDSESDRVRTDTFGTSVNGTDLLFALVGSEDNVAKAEQIAASQSRLRDPRRTPPGVAENIAASSPAIVWYTANIHGGETSGGDAALSVLFNLAARTDCLVEEDLLENLVIGIMPTQNPDGRDALNRRNEFGFDLNRDWFAWTQQETDSKMRLLAQFPMVMFIDAHEMGGSRFWTPPNADPIYHEITSESLRWINEIYGASIDDEFARRREEQPGEFDLFHFDPFDLFYIGFGDTVPTTAFTSAGMTFEKGAADTLRQRWLEQFVAGWTSIQAAAANKEDILNEYYDAHVEALAQGRAGALEPNMVQEPDSELLREVPDLTVRNYFLLPDRGFPDLARLLDRLLTLGVEVFQLTAPARVPDLQAYGRDVAPTQLPAGTYWIPMDQPQKHWIQAMLNEDTYVPFPFFFDVTAWSNPLLMNLDGAFSGERLRRLPATPLRRAPGGSVTGPIDEASFFWWRGDTGDAVAGALELERQGFEVRRLGEDTSAGGATLPAGAFLIEAGAGVLPAVPAVSEARRLQVRGATGDAPAGIAVDEPSVALFSPPGFSESFEHMRFILEGAWNIGFETLTGADVAAGELSGHDVFIVPGGRTTSLDDAADEIESWIEEGGIYGGTSRPGATGGTPFAVANGFTTSTLSDPEELQVPGTMFRVAVDDSTPLTLGASDFSFWYHLGERVLSPSTTGVNAALYPEEEPDFFFSGFADGADALKGTAGLVEESRGDGRVILFSGEPNFRAYTEASAFLLTNALIYPLGAAPAAVDVGSAAVSDEVEAAEASAEAETGPGRPIRIEVPAGQAGQASAVIAEFTDNLTVERVRGSAFLEIPDPQDRAADEHPFARDLIPALRNAGVEVRSAIL